MSAFTISAALLCLAVAVSAKGECKDRGTCRTQTNPQACANPILKEWCPVLCSTCDIVDAIKQYNKENPAIPFSTLSEEGQDSYAAAWRLDAAIAAYDAQNLDKPFVLLSSAEQTRFVNDLMKEWGLIPTTTSTTTATQTSTTRTSTTFTATTSTSTTTSDTSTTTTSITSTSTSVTTSTVTLPICKCEIYGGFVPRGKDGDIFVQRFGNTCYSGLAAGQKCIFRTPATTTTTRTTATTTTRTTKTRTSKTRTTTTRTTTTRTSSTSTQTATSTTVNVATLPTCICTKSALPGFPGRDGTVYVQFGTTCYSRISIGPKCATRSPETTTGATTSPTTLPATEAAAKDTTVGAGGSEPPAPTSAGPKTQSAVNTNPGSGNSGEDDDLGEESGSGSFQEGNAGDVYVDNSAGKDATTTTLVTTLPLFARLNAAGADSAYLVPDEVIKGLDTVSRGNGEAANDWTQVANVLMQSGLADTSFDGTISTEEFFAFFDTNGDYKVTESEFNSVLNIASRAASQNEPPAADEPQPLSGDGEWTLSEPSNQPSGMIVLIVVILCFLWIASMVALLWSSSVCCRHTASADAAPYDPADFSYCRNVSDATEAATPHIIMIRNPEIMQGTFPYVPAHRPALSPYQPGVGRVRELVFAHDLREPSTMRPIEGNYFHTRI